MRLSYLSSPLFTFFLLLSSTLIHSTLSFSLSSSPLPLPQSLSINHAPPPILLPRQQSLPYLYPNPNAPSASLEGAGLPGGRRTKLTSPAARHNLRIAHGTLMGLAFALLLPIGATILRLFPNIRSANSVLIHATTQLTAYTIAIAGLGIGIWLGLNVRYLDYAHTVIGMAVLGAMACQVGLGWWVHVLYRQRHHRNGDNESVDTAATATSNKEALVPGAEGKGRVRRWIGYTHVWLGRCLVLLGMINGGLGLDLAKNTKKGEIGYGVVAGVIGAGYLIVIITRGARGWWAMSKRRN